MTTLTAQTHQHGTRLSKFTTIFLENARNHTGGMAHLNREYVQIWNNLPNTLRSIPTYTTFKKELKLHLLKLQHSDEEPDPKEKTLKKDQLRLDKLWRPYITVAILIDNIIG